MRVLYAEDEIGLSEAVTDILEYHKYTVDAVYDGKTALEYSETGDYDCIILDIMMPAMSGMEVLLKLRASGNKTPILMLTAKSDIEDKVEGLDSGADDYLAKPFETRELLARIRALTRRRENFTPDIISVGNTTLDLSTYRLSTPGGSVGLSKKELQMMEIFMTNKGIYISAETFLTKIWGYDTESEIGSVWAYITYLRRKLAALGSDVKIKAKRNVGYTLEV